MKVQARTTFDRLRFDAESEIHLVLSLTAPAIDWQEQRTPLAIMLAIDVSGSMQGPKLEYAKRSALKLVEHLKDNDYVGLVAFESNVKMVFSPQKASQEAKTAIISAIQKLHTLGGTNLSGGMLSSLEALKRLDLPVEYMTRVVLLTDGQANEGIATKSEAIISLLEKQAGRSTLSAFGYGAGAGADQNLLEGMSLKGKGNYAFIENPDDALSAFAKELGGLLSTYAQDVEIEVSPQNGHCITSVVSDVELANSDVLGEVTIKIPNVLAEETRHLVLAVKLSKQTQALPRLVNLADITVKYRTLKQGGDIESRTEEVKARIRFVKEGEEQKTPTKDIDTIVALAQMVKVQKDAESKAKSGLFVEAQALMQNYAIDVNSRGHDAISFTSSRLGSRMTDAHTYSNSSGYFRSISNGVTRSVGTASFSAEAALDLTNVGCSLNTTSQTNMVNQFAGGNTAAPNVAPEVPVLDLSAPGLLGILNCMPQDQTVGIVQPTSTLASSTPTVHWGSPMNLPKEEEAAPAYLVKPKAKRATKKKSKV